MMMMIETTTMMIIIIVVVVVIAIPRRHHWWYDYGALLFWFDRLCGSGYVSAFIRLPLVMPGDPSVGDITEIALLGRRVNSLIWNVD